MYSNALAQELYEAFNEFKNTMPAYRQTQLRVLVRICDKIKREHRQNCYVAKTITEFLELCEQMAKKRQPKSYKESTLISFALGEISTIDVELADE